MNRLATPMTNSTHAMHPSKNGVAPDLPRQMDPSREAAQMGEASALPGLMRRTIVLAYGVACYALFFGTFLYALGWLSGIGGLTPTTLDALPRPGSASTATAVIIDLLLLLVFAVQHSVMARPWFKRAWTKIVPVAAERSTYVLFSSLALIAMFVAWQPLGGVVWDVENSMLRMAILVAFATGAGLVLASTCLIHHLDLFGLRQVWLYFRGREYTALAFKTPVFYRFVRHPLYVGWMITFFAAPTMTAAHLLFAAVTTIYMLAAIRWEERDLMAAHPEYAQYRQRVGMLFPRRSNAIRTREGIGV